MIFNLTQHDPTPEQIAQGLGERSPELKALVASLLTFTAEDIRQEGKIVARAQALATVAKTFADQGGEVLIGGLPALMGPLVEELRAVGLVPVFAHSDRVKEDQPQPDGTVKTVGVFKHQFFYPAPWQAYRTPSF